MEVDSNDCDIAELKRALAEAKGKLTRVCKHLNHLDEQISYLRKLFRRAERNNGYAIRYNLRMQLSIVSGVKVMYHRYATVHEEKVNTLKAQLAVYLPETSVCEEEEQQPPVSQ